MHWDDLEWGDKEEEAEFSSGFSEFTPLSYRTSMCTRIWGDTERKEEEKAGANEIVFYLLYGFLSFFLLLAGRACGTVKALGRHRMEKRRL
jgi:hypothetical protein